MPETVNQGQEKGKPEVRKSGRVEEGKGQTRNNPHLPPMRCGKVKSKVLT